MCTLFGVQVFRNVKWTRTAVFFFSWKAWHGARLSDLCACARLSKILPGSPCLALRLSERAWQTILSKRVWFARFRMTMVIVTTWCNHLWTHRFITNTIDLYSFDLNNIILSSAVESSANIVHFQAPKPGSCQALSSLCQALQRRLARRARLSFFEKTLHWVQNQQNFKVFTFFVNWKDISKNLKNFNIFYIQVQKAR